MDEYPCTICHQSKPASEFPTDNVNGRIKIRRQCKACRKERYGAANNARVKQRTQDHPEYMRQYQAQKRAERKALGLPPDPWAAANHERTREIQRASQARNAHKHREKNNAYAKAHREANLEEIRGKQRLHQQGRRAADPQKHRDENKAWRLAHLDKQREMNIHYRAQRSQSAIIDLSEAQWEEIKAAKGYRCDYCGKKSKSLTKDHVTPLIKRGDHTLWNIVVACRPCNSRKNAGSPLKPVQPLLLTIAPKKPKKLS